MTRKSLSTEIWAKSSLRHQVSVSHELLVHSCVLWTTVIKTLLAESLWFCGAAGPDSSLWGAKHFLIWDWRECCMFFAWQTSAADKMLGSGFGCAFLEVLGPELILAKNLPNKEGKKCHENENGFWLCFFPMKSNNIKKIKNKHVYHQLNLQQCHINKYHYTIIIQFRSEWCVTEAVVRKVRDSLWVGICCSAFLWLHYFLLNVRQVQLKDTWYQKGNTLQFNFMATTFTFLDYVLIQPHQGQSENYPQIVGFFSKHCSYVLA